MTILVGTDFTPPALAAARAALALARRRGLECALAHVAEPREAGEPEVAPEQTRHAAERLRQEAERLAGAGVEPRTELLTGLPDVELAELAARSQAELIVLGALGRRSPREWSLGSTADRVARTSPVPVLVVRAAEPFEAWARGERPLRVLLALDLSESSDAAVRWTAELAASGPCTVIPAHVYWPVEVRARLGLPPAGDLRGGAEIPPGMPIGAGHADVERALAPELARRLAPLAGAEPRLLGGLGRVADHLVQLAVEERADLIAVGNRQRSGLQRLWHGSVSQGVLDLAPTSVVCVPA